MKLNFNKISQNQRYGYGRVSSREQAENSSNQYTEKAEASLKEIIAETK